MIDVINSGILNSTKRSLENFPSILRFQCPQTYPQQQWSNNSLWEMIVFFPKDGKLVFFGPLCVVFTHKKAQLILSPGAKKMSNGILLNMWRQNRRLGRLNAPITPLSGMQGEADNRKLHIEKWWDFPISRYYDEPLLPWIILNWKNKLHFFVNLWSGCVNKAYLTWPNFLCFNLKLDWEGL